VQPDLYLGVDRDEAILEVARRRYPDHRFLKAHHPQDVDQDVFDTVVCLAVIEHVAAPAQLLSGLARLLTKKGRLVVTTPHPSYEALYEFGVRLGLFSHTALHEHQDLIGPDQMRRICAEAGLSVVRYRRFLFLANQLFVVRPKPTDVIGTVSGRPSGGALP
jgi:2-polyprenyl-3-methyl-5-hydroxy-6-metoxy-1,4-benzoquinol methylase